MTQQKLAITTDNAADAIFQKWRTGQNATVESVMKSLGTTHRQKINNLMAEARLKAGEMIQQREVESELEGGFPADAFAAIREWALNATSKRLEQREQDLLATAEQLANDREAYEAEKKKHIETIAKLEASEQQLNLQLNAYEKRFEQAELQANAKIAGLESALNEVRERAGQAESRCEVTQHELVSAQNEARNSARKADQLSEKLEVATQDLAAAREQAVRLTQEKEHQSSRYAEMEMRHQNREAQWLSERDERLKKELSLNEQLTQLDAKVAEVTLQRDEYQQALNEMAIAQAEFTQTIQEFQQQEVMAQNKLQMTEVQLSDSKEAQQNQWYRLIELERHNAALQAQLSRADSKNEGDLR